MLPAIASPPNGYTSYLTDMSNRYISPLKNAPFRVMAVSPSRALMGIDRMLTKSEQECNFVVNKIDLAKKWQEFVTYKNSRNHSPVESPSQS